MRWTSSAVRIKKLSPPRRERFSPLSVVLGTFFAFMLLLALLFPQQRLLDILNHSHAVDAATVRYLEALLRIHPKDTPLRMRLAGELMRQGTPHKALALMSGFPKQLSPLEKRTILELHYRVLRAILFAPDKGEGNRQRYLADFADAARQLADDKSTVSELRRFATDVREAGDLETSRAFSRQADILAASLAPATSKGMPVDPFAVALARGDYRTAAGICFNNMKLANSNSLKREHFIKGVRTLQSGNLPVEAFEAGERHLNGLADDREALVFLTKVGLAAGKPERAQRLIKRALKMTEKPSSADMS